MLTKKPSLKDKHAIEAKLKKELEKKEGVKKELDKVEDEIDSLTGETKIKINKQ